MCVCSFGDRCKFSLGSGHALRFASHCLRRGCGVRSYGYTGPIDFEGFALRREVKRPKAGAAQKPSELFGHTGPVDTKGFAGLQQNPATEQAAEATALRVEACCACEPKDPVRRCDHTVHFAPFSYKALCYPDGMGATNEVLTTSEGVLFQVDRRVLEHLLPLPWELNADPAIVARRWYTSVWPA